MKPKGHRNKGTAGAREANTPRYTPVHLSPDELPSNRFVLYINAHPRPFVIPPPSRLLLRLPQLPLQRRRPPPLRRQLLAQRPRLRHPALQQPAALGKLVQHPQLVACLCPPGAIRHNVRRCKWT